MKFLKKITSSSPKKNVFFYLRCKSPHRFFKTNPFENGLKTFRSYILYRYCMSQAVLQTAKHERNMAGREYIEVADHYKYKPRNN
jgi:hypothetical protein